MRHKLLTKDQIRKLHGITRSLGTDEPKQQLNTPPSKGVHNGHLNMFQPRDNDLRGLKQEAVVVQQTSKQNRQVNTHSQKGDTAKMEWDGVKSEAVSTVNQQNQSRLESKQRDHEIGAVGVYDFKMELMELEEESDFSDDGPRWLSQPAKIRIAEQQDPNPARNNRPIVSNKIRKMKDKNISKKGKQIKHRVEAKHKKNIREGKKKDSMSNQIFNGILYHFA